MTWQEAEKQKLFSGEPSDLTGEIFEYEFAAIWSAGNQLRSVDDGHHLYFASSVAHSDRVSWGVDFMKHHFLSGPDADDLIDVELYHYETEPYVDPFGDDDDE